ncbi:hypothetical protein BJ138DRAFT_1181082 [Hygrophoropsis aurantiaca]|uniref:Uncharacterized protein n=1 Tax=Hygrophoropsis aurantiaca TaxID=72124 RepID=A0ACB8A7W8_9AGAM|nr:hypothetical protein BJ138DRAFT_1181082 [Hygrophoropsis aurantiaca]
MNTLFSRASLKRSPRTQTRKSSISRPIIGCPPSRSSTTTKHKTKALHIIPELSEIETDSADECLLAPASPSPVAPSPRVTLSAYTFSIDDALLLVNDELRTPPRSPALSASSSTSGSSDGVPTTPATSDDEDAFSFDLPSPCMRPKRITIRPLCINKTRSVIDEVEDIFESAEETVDEQKVDAEEEVDDHDFYTHHFQDFISLYSPLPPSFPISRPDSPVLATVSESEAKPRGRSRHSKPLPLIPIPTPPMSTFPLVPPVFPSVIRRKRIIHAIPAYPPPPPPSRPPPRMSIPSDIEDLDISLEEEDEIERIEIEQIYEDETCDETPRLTVSVEEEEKSIYSQDTAYTTPAPPSASALSPAFPETPTNAMYDLPRSSVDSDAPRSSVDSCPPSSCSSTGFSFSSSSDDHEFDAPHLRSRWSSSTLSSLATRDEPRSLLSPLRGVFGSRARRMPATPTPLSSRARHGPSLSAASFFPSPSPSPLTPRHLPPSSHAHSHFPSTPSPPSSPAARGIRRSQSRSSTSSGSGSVWGGSECSDCSSSNGGLRRKPIPVEMFLRC